MTQAVPISLILDDSCPFIHLYRYHMINAHGEKPLTWDGRPLLETIPNEFLDRFCDVAERWNIAGKFSIVPAPANRGDVVRGIEGFPPEQTRQWLDTVQSRLSARFDFSPEMLTHDFAIDLATGEPLAETETKWSQSQNRTTLTPYITRSLQILKDAGVDATGVTSPWEFGTQVEAEYTAAIAAAQQAVYGRKLSWYYLHGLENYPCPRPYISYARDGVTVVATVSTVDDYFWGTMGSPRTDDEFITSVADGLISADGRSGAIRRVLDTGGWPMLVTHWQCLFSNGLETGLQALELVAQRVATTLGDEVQWMSCLEVAQLTVDNWQAALVESAG